MGDYNISKEAVYVASEPLEGEAVKGWDFNQGVDYKSMFSQYGQMGFQATALGESIGVINDMVFLAEF